MSGSAAAFYVCLFATCRQLVSSFLSSNPTWLKAPKSGEGRIETDEDTLYGFFRGHLNSMTKELETSRAGSGLFHNSYGESQINICDTSRIQALEEQVDMALTSPPYCTRIDYTAATRIELAVLDLLLKLDALALSRRMMGSVRVPLKDVERDDGWGHTCIEFLRQLENHASKASNGYYRKTHHDYFHKMFKSMLCLAKWIKTGGGMVVVAQDSYYKEVHNNLPQIIVEMASNVGFELQRRSPFSLGATMAAINPNSRKYFKPRGAVEEVLCFDRS